MRKPEKLDTLEGRRRSQRLAEKKQQLLLSPPTSTSTDEKAPNNACNPKQGRLAQKRKHSTSDGILPNAHKKAKPTTDPPPCLQTAANNNPVKYWTETGRWPKRFTDSGTLMASRDSSSKKRLRSQSRPSQETQSYSQSRKENNLPDAYTAAYETHILTKGLNMDILNGKKFISEASKAYCHGLEKAEHTSIKPTVFPLSSIQDVIHRCGNRNEALVNRDITPLIIPPLVALLFSGESYLEAIVDEVNVDWNKSCVIEGPQLRPDLAIGLFASAFTDEEVGKLKIYHSVDNWTQFTAHMYFPFLMLEAKSGGGALDVADRQNMHSCSVAARAILRIVQEADKYREGNEIFESLDGQVLVFSISHDNQDARLYGHYATIGGEKWKYYRYRIGKFDLTSNGLLGLHNFVRNVLKSYSSVHMNRLKDALKAFPAPSTISISASELSLADSSRENSQAQDSDGFKKPPNVNQLIQQLEDEKRERERDRKVAEERYEHLMERQRQQMQESKEREEKLMEQMQQLVSKIG